MSILIIATNTLSLDFWSFFHQKGNQTRKVSSKITVFVSKILAVQTSANSEIGSLFDFDIYLFKNTKYRDYYGCFFPLNFF